jgi:aquaporin Z
VGFNHQQEGVTVKAYVAEFIGTFTLVFIGCASVALSPAGTGPIMPALAHGLALMSAIYALGHISGAHVNPAVTFGVAIAGAIGWGQAVIYFIAQILGALVAALILSGILPGQAANFGAFSFTTTSGSALLLEAVLTFFLVSVVLQAAVAGKAGPAAGFAIGLTLGASILAGGPVTGASLNPARTIGPAIVAGNMSQVWVYIIGTLLGGAVAAVVHRYVLGIEK